MDASKLFKGIKEFFSRDRRLKIIVLLGLIGMLMILISQFLSHSEPPRQSPDEATASFTSDEYIDSLEKKLQQLVTGIDGVGRAEVMVTLESGVEYVYAQEEKRNTDTTREPEGEEAVTVSLRENVEQKYILVETEYGKREALVLTERQPRVQGVVIVCEGADSIYVQEKLTSVVTTALGIPSTRVCVVKIG